MSDAPGDSDHSAGASVPPPVSWLPAEPSEPATDTWSVRPAEDLPAPLGDGPAAEPAEPVGEAEPAGWTPVSEPVVADPAPAAPALSIAPGSGSAPAESTPVVEEGPPAVVEAPATVGVAEPDVIPAPEPVPGPTPIPEPVPPPDPTPVPEPTPTPGAQVTEAPPIPETPPVDAAATAGERTLSVAADHPEYLVAAALVAGYLVAKVLKRLAG